ncbi:CYTH domain-containing protein [Croceivirga radicis]|uniref:CYTH domain-containing protein n=1 Tax=Croceivirga radicis TaxID=1929488 RepID=UPI000255B57B|nr:CYTH domain-containing protein [Croceivirga radicis]
MEHLEIERKFLILSDTFKKEAYQKDRLVQGYLNTHPDRTVRVRIMNHEAFMTVKGPTNTAGTSRFEWEINIPVEEATNLIDLCETGILEKYRYRVPVGRHIFEVDEFLGENKGLIVAEIELQHENEPFEKPNWLGKEVTGDKRYYNSALTKKPFTTW